MLRLKISPDLENLQYIKKKESNLGVKKLKSQSYLFN